MTKVCGLVVGLLARVARVTGTLVTNGCGLVVGLPTLLGLATSLPDNLSGLRWPPPRLSFGKVEKFNCLEKKKKKGNLLLSNCRRLDGLS